MRTAHSETVTVYSIKAIQMHYWRILHAPRQNGGVFCQQMVLFVEITLTCVENLQQAEKLKSS